MGKAFLFLALVATSVMLWRSGRLDSLLHLHQSPLERKVQGVLAEGGWTDATVEDREKDILVNIPLGRDSEKWRAEDEGRHACTRIAEALDGDRNVTVVVHGATTENGYAPVFGCAGYSAKAGSISWQAYN
jgi:hypothetical protein